MMNEHVTFEKCVNNMDKCSSGRHIVPVYVMAIDDCEKHHTAYMINDITHTHIFYWCTYLQIYIFIYTFYKTLRSFLTLYIYIYLYFE